MVAGVPESPCLQWLCPREGRAGPQPGRACDCGMPHWEEGITWRRTHIPKVMGLCRKLIVGVLESQLSKVF